MPRADALAVVIVAHNSAGDLPGLLDDLQEQRADGDEIVVVDNLSHDATAEVARRHPLAATVIEPGTNLGFAAGCHAGSRATTAPLLLFINPDSRLAPSCLDHLRAAAATHPEWGAWQAAVMTPDGSINSDGGVVHFLGMGWAGHCGHPAAELPPGPTEPAFPSGAAMVVRRGSWDRLGGLDASYFLYGEDLDLGLRVWLAGERVGMLPDAQVIHSYEFDKGIEKWFWLERNRLRTVLSVYPAPLLLLVTPALLASEIALLVIAARGGWLSAKLRAQRAALGGLASTLRRRRQIATTRRISTRAFAGRLTSALDSTFLPVGTGGGAERLQAWYWAAVTGLIALLTR